MKNINEYIESIVDLEASKIVNDNFFLYSDEYRKMKEIMTTNEVILYQAFVKNILHRIIHDIWHNMKNENFDIKICKEMREEFSLGICCDIKEIYKLFDIIIETKKQYSDEIKNMNKSFIKDLKLFEILFNDMVGSLVFNIFVTIDGGSWLSELYYFSIYYCGKKLEYNFELHDEFFDYYEENK